jgi:hypothetical protein
MRLTKTIQEDEEKIETTSLPNLSSLPSSLKEELTRFADRNCLVALENSFDGVCLSCLKAHALAEAKKFNLTKSLIESIKTSFDGRIGHNGYYMDKDKLIRIKRV